MDELIKMVAGKIGVSEEQAKEAVNTVLGFVKDKLPAPIAAQVDGVMKGEMPDLGDAAKSIGGVFGG